MSRPQVYVTLPPDVISEVWRWSRAQHIKNRFTSHDAERNQDMQAWSRLCEKALAHWAGLPFNAVDLDNKDSSDVVIDAMRCDVKSCEMFKQLLCWPAKKVSEYETRSFTHLVLVKHEAMPRVRFKIEGWVTKLRFRQEKFIAPAGPAATLKTQLDRDTWYMHQNALDSMATFNFQNKQGETA